MKKIILILIMMLFIASVYCDERQDISTILYPNILNNDLYARNDFLTNKTNYTKSTTKDTVSISPILKRPKGCFTFALDTVVMPGIKIGFGSIKYDSTSTKEKIVVIHGSFGAIWPIFYCGIHSQINTFSSIERKGFFTSYNIGIDYAIAFGADPGGGQAGSTGFLLPYFSIGGGYSFKIGRSSFFRISGDLGLKLLIGNFTLSYVF